MQDNTSCQCAVSSGHFGESHDGVCRCGSFSSCCREHLSGRRPSWLFVHGFTLHCSLCLCRTFISEANTLSTLTPIWTGGSWRWRAGSNDLRCPGKISSINHAIDWPAAECSAHFCLFHRKYWWAPETGIKLDIWLTINYLFWLWRIVLCWNVFVSLEAVFSSVNTDFPVNEEECPRKLSPFSIYSKRKKKKVRLHSHFAGKLFTFVHSSSSLMDFLSAFWPKPYELL